MRTPTIGLLTASLMACGGVQGIDDTGLEDEGVAISEGSLRARGLLEYLNGSEVSLQALDVDADLDSRAALNILQHVRGRDRILGTRDDNPFDTMAELDAIAYVGRSALEKLAAYVASIGGMPDLVVEDVALTRAQADAMIAFANTMTTEQLDVDVALDARAAKAIVAGRPIGNIEALAAVSYVGKVAITQLRNYADSNPSPNSGGGSSLQAPIPYVLQWINDYRGTGQVSRLNLNADGSYDATVAGAQERGSFHGPRSLPQTQGIDLRLIAANGTAWTAHLTLYSSESAEVTRAGRSSTLHATLPTDGEDACDTGGGQYLDDDANSDGLYCACPSDQSWIPSQGGCVGGLTTARRQTFEQVAEDMMRNNDWYSGTVPDGSYASAELFHGEPQGDGCVYTALVSIAPTTPGGPSLDPNTVELVWVTRTSCPDGVARYVTTAVPVGS